MKTALTLLLLISFHTPLFAQDREKALAITHVTVIDATGAPPVPDMTVVISRGRITKIGKATNVKLSGNARVIDARGRYLIPGLWDMHAHFWNEDHLLRLFIANGVTGVRDMGGALERVTRWRRLIRERKLIGPRIVAAGPPLDGTAFELPQLNIRPGVVKSSEEAKAAVVALKKGGADFIKILSELSRDSYFAVVSEARRQRIDFAGHVPYSISAMEASDAGQKSMEHLFGIELACSSEEASLRKPLFEALAKQDWKTYLDLSNRLLDTYSDEKARLLFSRFVKNGTYQVPTLTLLKRMGYLFDEDPTKNPALKYIPRSLKDKWENPLEGRKNLSARARDYFPKQFRRSCEIVRAMSRAGVRIMAGTDTGDAYTYPGFTLHEELELLVFAGLTPMEALQSATRNPAEYFRLQHSLGTVEEGKIADLVLLEANPLDDISNIKQINAVIVEGEFYAKPELQHMLAEVEATAGAR